MTSPRQGATSSAQVKMEISPKLVSVAKSSVSFYSIVTVAEVGRTANPPAFPLLLVHLIICYGTLQDYRPIFATSELAFQGHRKG